MADPADVRVLVAPDKFKGTLTAAEVADAVAIGLERTGLHALQLPLADGGDGSVDAALAAGYSAVSQPVTDAVGQNTVGTMAVDETSDTVIVEVANTVGIAGLSGLDPMGASSFGFGVAVAAALERRPRRLVLALGGSASTDGGMGLLQALGAVFTDSEGHELSARGDSLSRVHSADTSRLSLPDTTEIVIASDVTNPLLGPDGAATVFGPQKGATPDQQRDLELGMSRLLEVLVRDHGSFVREVAERPSAGAAGGLGFAAMLIGGHATSGAAHFLDLLDFDGAAAGCDAVVTGEGCVDAQTLHGKLPAVVIERATPRPVHLVAGRNELTDDDQADLGVSSVQAVSTMTPHDTAADPALTRELLVDAGVKIARILARHSEVQRP